MVSEYLLDTSAWVEQFGSSPKGLKIRALIEQHSVATSIMAITEWADKCAKENWDALPGIQFMKKWSEIIPLSISISLKAAEIKKKLRQENPKFGLADSIHLATARQENAILVTCDHDFKDVEGVMLL